MATNGDQLEFSGLAARDLSGHQYKAVRVTGVANTIDVASLNTVQHAVGILQNDPDAAGKMARVAYAGETKAVAGGTITGGTPLSHNNSGFVIAATSGLIVIGQAMEAANANDIFRMLIQRGGICAV